MDPITLAVGACIALISFGIGHVNGRHRRALSSSPATCEGCGDNLSHHDQSGRCHATRIRKTWSKGGASIGRHAHPCTCQQYVGPIPADRMLASFTPPTLPVPAPATPEIPDRQP